MELMLLRHFVGCGFSIFPNRVGFRQQCRVCLDHIALTSEALCEHVDPSGWMAEIEF
jgi:hypothetical protein